MSKKMCFFLMSQGSFNPKITTVGTFSGFQDSFLQPIIKDRHKNGECNFISIEVVGRPLTKYQFFSFFKLFQDMP